jgi:hypothetical protein
LLGPIPESRDETHIFHNVLLTDPQGWNLSPRRESDGVIVRMAEQLNGHLDSLSMMPQSTMAEVTMQSLAGIKPFVDGEIVFDFSAPPFFTGQRMMICGSHVVSFVKNPDTSP